MELAAIIGYGVGTLLLLLFAYKVGKSYIALIVRLIKKILGK